MILVFHRILFSLWTWSCDPGNLINIKIKYSIVPYVIKYSIVPYVIKYSIVPYVIKYSIVPYVIDNYEKLCEISGD